jgi:hypothetical protein
MRLICAALALSASLLAYDVNIAWDPSPEPDVNRYRVWTNGARLAEVPSTQTNYMLTNLSGQINITLTALNVVGQESAQCPPLVWLAPEMPPMVTILPLTQAIRFHSPLLLTALATNFLGLQWYKNNTLINGATNINYLVAQVKDSDAGSYSVSAWNAAGRRSSTSVAIVVFHVPPGMIKNLREEP